MRVDFIMKTAIIDRNSMDNIKKSDSALMKKSLQLFAYSIQFRLII